MKSYLNKLLLFATAILSLLIVSLQLSSEISAQEPPTEDAIEKLAIQYSGFSHEQRDNKTNDKQKLEVVNLQNLETPFLSHLVGRRAWQIPFSDDTLIFERSPGITFPGQLKNFTFFIDSIDGNLLRVISRNEDFDQKRWNRTSAQTREDILLSGDHSYVGLVSEKPKINFWEALNGIRGCNPLLCEELVAYCVEYKKDEIVSPVWIFELSGVSTIFWEYNRSNPDPDRSRLIVLVDAETGKFVRGNNQF